MKVYEIVFKRSKNKRLILSVKSTPEEAENYIDKYEGHHNKRKIYYREKNKIENPFRKRRMRKAS